MPGSVNRQKVDELIDHFWKNGFLTLSRKYGKYLPSPHPVGTYEVDAIGKYKQKIAIGITLTAEELNDPKLFTKISFLASRQTKYSNKKVTLFIGVPNEYLNKAKIIIASLEDNLKKNIKIVALEDRKK